MRLNSERPSVETCLQADTYETERAHSLVLYGERLSVECLRVDT